VRVSALAFLAGILWVQQLDTLPDLHWGWLLLPALALARYRRVALPVVFLVAGALWVSLRAGWVLDEQLPAELEGRDLRLDGHVADLPVTRERGTRFVLDVIAARDDDAPVTVPHRVQLSTYDPGFRPQAGQRLRLTARLKRPHGFRNPGGFDYEAHLFQQRLRAFGYVRAHPPPERVEQDATAYPLARLRARVSRDIAERLPDNRYAGMITAFANGDRSGIDSAQWEALRRTGTTHLIAISGMHIGLVAGAVFLVARRLWALAGRAPLWLPAPQAAALIALLAGAGYAALAGFAIPTQRALVMLAAGLSAGILLRQVATGQLLALALLAVLIFDPLSVMAGGFWLSFLAVAAILYVVHGVGRARGLRQYGRELVRVQWAVTIGLLPVLIVLFQQVSLAAPLANLLAIPVIGMATIPATLLGVAVEMTGLAVLAGGLFQFAAWSLDLLWRPLEALAGVDGVMWSAAQPPAWALPCAALGVALLLAPRGWPGRWLGAIWLLPLLAVRPAGPAPGELWLTLLDVGQGLAVVARTAGHTLVYDTGARFSPSFDAGSAVLVPYLRYHGIGRVDTLVVSHGDNDHLGGAAALRAALPVGRMLTSVPEQLPGAAPCQAPDGWRWDGVEFRLLHPPLPGPGNDSSCVLKIESAAGGVLLPGDIGVAAERALVARHGDALAASVLVAPHHGSKTSSSPELLAAVAPQAVLIPAGYRNPYGHPHPSVVTRYAEAGIDQYDSARHGALALRWAGGAPRVEAWRERARRYWHAR